ncbi:MAG TPA: MFS transporter [Flavobacteriales bacterium]
MSLFARSYRYYIGSFAGLGREVWLLAFITFVNRAGTMVVPFLSLYLTQDMGLALEQVGWIMSSFGAGSVVGAWMGGKLTDRIGFYTVMVWALITSGICFVLLQYVEGYLSFCLGIFVLTLLSDAFRPAMFVAVGSYAGPQHRTRAITLIRLAINLGFSMGPACGGLIIALWGYPGLFWVDGLTCVVAAGLMLRWLPQRSASVTPAAVDGASLRSPYQDRPYLFFLLTTVLIAVPFLQYFSTMPLYYSQVHGLDELGIGLLLGMNGLLIFLLEMPLVRFCEDRRFRHTDILLVSTVLMALSFLVLNVAPFVAVLWVGMALVTVGEMLNFPFANRLAYERADRGKPGSYMALFTIAWAVAHIVGHTLGLQMVARFGFDNAWYFFGGLLLVAIVLLMALKRMLAEEAAPGSAAPPRTT